MNVKSSISENEKALSASCNECVQIWRLSTPRDTIISLGCSTEHGTVLILEPIPAFQIYVARLGLNTLLIFPYAGKQPNVVAEKNWDGCNRGGFTWEGEVLN